MRKLKFFLAISLLILASCGTFIEPIEHVNKRLRKSVDFKDITPKEWTNSMAGVVDDGVNFSGVWRDIDEGNDVTLRQVDNLLYFGEEKWSISGSKAYMSKYFTSKNDFGRTIYCLGIWKAWFINSDTIQVNIDISYNVGNFDFTYKITSKSKYKKIRD